MAKRKSSDSGAPARPPQAFLDNQWKPGQSGNPSGRPRTKPITDEINRQLERCVPGDPQGRTFLQLMVEASLKRAIQKSDEMVKEIINRIEGKQRPLDEDEDVQAARGVKVVIVDVQRPNRKQLMPDVGPAPVPKK